MHEGYYSTIYGLKGIPAASEEIMIARDIILAELTGGHLHICHASTRGAIEQIRNAKARGLRISCEVTPHHLTLTDEIVGTYDADTKVYPPLRSQDDVQAVIDGLIDGTIDCIATDHAPHHRESKDCEYELASPGISGLETAAAVIMDRLVGEGILDVEEMVALFTSGPASVLGLDKGDLTPGKMADITVLNPEKIKTVNPADFYSKGKNTPFKGMAFKGWPCLTMVNGKVIARDGIVLDKI